MATHAIGKLKFNTSGQGLAFRWGDGTVHRLFGGKKKQADGDDYLNENLPEGEDAYQDDYDARDGDYADDYDDRDEGYDDDYADDDYADDGYVDDGYADDDYADDGYDDDGYADDDYADDNYDDGGYDDEGYDDDYADDDYADDGYADDGYGDRYQDEDADDAYGDGYYNEQSGFMRYVDENDWVTYLLLFLFPPLGIYLLWRRNRFDKPIRWAITAASAIWFVVALILLLRGLFGGTGDQQVQPDITIPPASVEQTVAPANGDSDITSIDLGGGTITDDEPSDEEGDADAEGDLTDASPSPTPLANVANGASSDTAAYVWSPASGLYYHASEDCPRIEQGVQVWRVTQEIAENSRHQSPCPDCIGGGTAVTYYGTLGGKYYHTDSKCSNMKNPLVYTKQAAENEGKTPCPVCILKTKDTLEESENVSTAIINKDTADKSGIQVYATKNGSYFHVQSDCSGMKGATKLPLKSALLSGKSACPVCCASAGTLVYCTSGGKSYHTDKNCQGMTGAKQVSLAEAMVLGKSKCDVCIKGSLTGSVGADASASAASGSGSVSLTNATGDDVKVYATKNGTYYHTNSTCSGMKNAQLYTLKSMLLAGKKACPTCASSANTKVYATKGGKYYHSYATCSGMTGASSGTLAEALAAGYKRCPECWGKTASTSAASATSSSKSSSKAAATVASKSKASSSSRTKTTTQSSSAARAQAAPSKATATNTYVYATRKGSYYHLNSGCGGMTGASRVTLKTAVKAGKKPCPICASAAKRTVYSTSKGDHYHVASVCAPSGMKNGTKRTLAEALLMNQTACPYCLSSRKAAAAAVAAASGKSSSTSTKTTTPRKSSSTYKSGKSGVRVYATVSGKYYHTRSSCSNISGTPSRVTLETALNYGKKACPVCASSATRKVYATSGGKYYHYSKSCAGSGAKQGSLASALAVGLDPCPYCVSHTATRSAASSGTYRSGTSGIKVYATRGSKYYHAKANCSGLTGASRISLETALNYGKKACPVCLGTASAKVYAVAGEKYYHYSKAHAGSGAIAGTLAAARALGLKACPTCTKLSAGTTVQDYKNGGAANAPVSIEIYPADGDTKVYVELGTVNTYYHKSAKCKKAGFSAGTAVSLQYATDWDFKACPYCNPPTSVIPGSSDT